MSSDLKSALESLQLNNYTSLIIVTAVVYDYLLTISGEIEYVWRRPWTWVSTAFVLVRYLGLCDAILSGLVGSTFIPGPVKVSTALFVLSVWEFPIFLNVADLVMILRVYAMWNRSKWILYALLFIYVPQVIISFILVGIYDNPNTHLSVTIAQVLNFSFCNGSLSNFPSLLSLYDNIPRFVLGAALLVLAVIQTAKQSIAMYKATKRLQPNRYMEQLAKDGIIYFLANELNNVTALLDGEFSGTINSTLMLFLSSFGAIAVFCTMPRFIISVRELYDSDVRGRCQGIDTGFGVSSQTISAGNTTVSAIAFADLAPGQGQILEGDSDELEGVQLGALGDDTRLV